jgi:formamidopyrimidine-DNA glycosylase
LGTCAGQNHSAPAPGWLSISKPLSIYGKPAVDVFHWLKMPELPEVETVRLGLAPALVGGTITAVERRRADLRFPFPADFEDRLVGRRIGALSRRAKFLLADLDSGDVLIMHLGMSGSFRIASGGKMQEPGVLYHGTAKLAAHDHVVFHLASGIRVTYNDPRRFGFMTLCGGAELAEHKYFKDLGIEPLGNGLNGATLAAVLAGRQAPLKAALLDQTLVAGIGNIYASEVLHRARLSPRRPAGSIVARVAGASVRTERLADAIRAVLSEALRAGGSSLRDHRQTDGSLGLFQHAFKVYDREGLACSTPGCSGTIKRIVQSGRATFYCGSCQH